MIKPKLLSEYALGEMVKKPHKTGTEIALLAHIAALEEIIEAQRPVVEAAVAFEGVVSHYRARVAYQKVQDRCEKAKGKG